MSKYSHDASYLQADLRYTGASDLQARATVIYGCEICLKLNLPIFLALVRQGEQSGKFFSLSAFNKNFIHSYL